MPWQRVVLILSGLFLLVVVWLGRYELVALPAGGQSSFVGAYRLDRWTGRVILIAGDEEVETKSAKEAAHK